MIKWILNKIVGNKNQREVRRLRPVAQRILDIETSWGECTQEMLVAKTRAWQKKLHRLTPLELPSKGSIQTADQSQLEAVALQINERFESLADLFPKLPTVEANAASIDAGKQAFLEIEPKFSKIRESYLEEILPEAFAAVKCAAKAMFGSEINVCNTPMKWEMIHFDVQLIGGIALHRGFIAEMATRVLPSPVAISAMNPCGWARSSTSSV